MNSSMIKPLKENLKNIIISEHMKKMYNLKNMQHKMSDINKTDKFHCC